MLAGLELPPAVGAKPAVTAVLADLRSGDLREVVVGSSSRAGKSTLVGRIAGRLAAVGDSHPWTDPVHLAGPVKFPDGWEAPRCHFGHFMSSIKVGAHGRI